MKLPKAGTMKPLKKVLGIILAIYGIELLIGNQFITEFIEGFFKFGISWIYALVMIVGAYFLFVTGRQR